MFKEASMQATSFPGSLILPPWASEERPWFGLVTCYCGNFEHQGGVLCNQAVCRVELCRAVTSPPSHAMLKSSLRAEILNSVYSDVYLKVRQVFLATINRGCDVVVVVSVGFMDSYELWTSSRPCADQFYSEVIVINRCFSFKCARSG